MQEWYVFRRGLTTYFGFGTREVAQRYLQFLHRHKPIDSFVMDRLDELFPTPSIAEVKASPHRVDMEAEMKGWRG